MAGQCPAAPTRAATALLMEMGNVLFGVQNGVQRMERLVEAAWSAAAAAARRLPAAAGGSESESPSP
jgi:hypothetical protein